MIGVSLFGRCFLFGLEADDSNVLERALAPAVSEVAPTESKVLSALRRVTMISFILYQW